MGGLGVTWRSHLSDGTEVAVKRLTAPGGDLSPRLQRLRRLGGSGSANLLGLLSVFQEDGSFWAAFRLDDGVRLSQLLERGRMSPACALVVGTSVLDALVSLHGAGLWHGAVHGRNVHVGRDGAVRLGDYGLAGDRPGESPAALRAADVRAAGALVASALRMVAGRRPEGSLPRAVRAITGSSRLLPAGYEAALASLTLREGARGMATVRRQERARAQLATMVAETMVEEGEARLVP